MCLDVTTYVCHPRCRVQLLTLIGYKSDARYIPNPLQPDLRIHGRTLLGGDVVARVWQGCSVYLCSPPQFRNHGTTSPNISSLHYPDCIGVFSVLCTVYRQSWLSRCLTMDSFCWAVSLIIRGPNITGVIKREPNITNNKASASAQVVFCATKSKTTSQIYETPYSDLMPLINT